MLYEFNGYRPVVHASAFVHPQAAVTGNVVIGRDVYIGGIIEHVEEAGIHSGDTRRGTPARTLATGPSSMGPPSAPTA